MTRRGAVVLGGIAMVALLLVAGVPAVMGQLVRVGAAAPEIASGGWVNSGPLSLEALRGKVVLVEFWTYG